MKGKPKTIVGAIFIGLSLFVVSACDRSADQVNVSGEVEFQMMDAPSDDPAIKNIFVTVADIKVDGKSVPQYTPQTLDLKAHEDGQLRLMGLTVVMAKTYDNITLVLDSDVAADGSSPGSYVVTQDGHRSTILAPGRTEITLSKEWQVSPDQKTTLIFDFEARKAVNYDPAGGYRMVTGDQLRNSIRMVDRRDVGFAKATFANPVEPGRLVVAYAYKKGTYTPSESQQREGDNFIFKNAVTDGTVKQGTYGMEYTLAYLDAGEYDIHFAQYRLEAGSSRYIYEGTLQTQTTVNDAIMPYLTISKGTTIFPVTTVENAVLLP